MTALLSLAALAWLGIADRYDAKSRADQTAITSTADNVRGILDRQRRTLDTLTRIAASQSDAAAQQFLDRLAAMAPGVKGAALADSTGTVQLRSAMAPDDAALRLLAADAAKKATVDPTAPLLVTQTVGEGNAALVGLARPWTDGDGRLAGVAVMAVDHNAFAGIALSRNDGSAVLGEAVTSDSRCIPISGFPLMLVVGASNETPMAAGWPFIALAGLSVASLLGLAAVLGSRLAAARRHLARQAEAEHELREELANAAAVADRSGEINRTKSQFFAQVTHELRTPLNAILGFSETIRQQIFGPIANARYLEYAGLIHDAGSHLLSLINDLLDEARIESGRMEIAPIRMSAPALARSALDLVELLALGREITIATSGLASCPDLNVDPRAMKQVLVNLLSNAIKYTPPGGRIDLHFLGRDDGGVAIEISDTGIGMSPDDLRVAFEPFGRAGGLEAQRQQGTGLGLSLARGLVRLHGGDLTLASRLHFGTTATVILPRTAAFGPTAAARAPTATEATAEAA
ncbi:MAG TPA: HAMP domain-containing sensor histidine kinase [Stellaceae bacterium]|nr:HAMP domain-containing sensor histidine kinase [Stellaceae bacterium]